ncbi:SdpI family protein [Telluribacter sp. SYSU D00476]|uniref:SdpI family protein n=1 Tax=Telluribacter sp. SYSU D00476 TaxID=2811430 RepID=UPI001FF37176|nr:SdpI family protein [Telluribacter sp. SYSU D00476]
MATKEFIKKESIIWIALLIPILYMILVWDRLPEQLPIHYTIQGEVDQYGPTWIMPLLHVGLYLLLLLLPRLDPRRDNFAIFGSTWYKLRLAIMVFLGYTTSVIITSSIGYEINVMKWILVGVFLLFIIFGNYLSTVRPNWTVGIRLPWTLENEKVWRKTHAFAGRLWFWTGVVAILIIIVLPTTVALPLLFTALMLIVIIPMVYAYLIYKAEKRHNYD